MSDVIMNQSKDECTLENKPAVEVDKDVKSPTNSTNDIVLIEGSSTTSLVDEKAESSNAQYNEIAGNRKVTVGESRAIKPTDIADLRRKEKGSFSSNKMGKFFALCTGAQMLLPSVPVLSSKPKNVSKDLTTSDSNSALKKTGSDHPEESSASAVEEKKKELLPSEGGSAVTLVDSEDDYSTFENTKHRNKGADNKKATVGEKCTIKPTDIAHLRKREKGVTCNKKVGNFFALCAGAQMLLPNTPVLRENPRDIAKEQKADDSVTEVKRPEANSRDGSQSPVHVISFGAKRKKLAEVPIFYCQLCDSSSNSEQTHMTHIQGKKHQKKLAAASGLVTVPMYGEGCNSSEMQRIKIEEAVPPHRVVKHGCMPLIQTKLDRSDSPCIGLNYVIEILRLDPTVEPMYVCELCNSICQPTTLLSHVIGYKHRLNYLKAIKPDTYAEVKILNVKKSELTKILEEHAEKLEERDGRGQMTVEQEVNDTQSFAGNERMPQPIHPVQVMPQFNPSPFQVEEIRFLPPAARMNMLEELSRINASEIITEMDANRMEYIISSFRQTLMNYKGLSRMDINLTSTPNYHPNHVSPAHLMTRPAMPSSMRPAQGRGDQGMWRPITSRKVNYPPLHDYPHYT